MNSPTMNTATSAAALPNVDEMLVIHRVFRREFPWLAELVSRVADGDVRRAGIVGGHVRLILSGLHMHHIGEDVVLWPLLLERASPSVDLVRTMQAQHAAVDELTERIEPVVEAWTTSGSVRLGAELAALLQEFARVLFVHLDLEEREILPLTTRHVTAGEWAQLGQHGQEAMSRKQLPLMFGAVLEDADEAERAEMYRVLPVPIRLVMRTVGIRQYRRYIARVRAV